MYNLFTKICIIALFVLFVFAMWRSFNLKQKLNALQAKQTTGKQRRVVIAANRYSDGRLLIGLRHWDIHMAKQYEAFEVAGVKPDDDDPEQGFLDNNGNFLTRQQAWVVAAAAGQIKRVAGDWDNELCSENIY